MTKIASFVSQNWIVPLYTVLSVHDIVSIQMKNIGLNILNTLYNMPYLPTKRHSENKMFEFRIQIKKKEVILFSLIFLCLKVQVCWRRSHIAEKNDRKYTDPNQLTKMFWIWTATLSNICYIEMMLLW